uniref:Uncharacterized protein n=1 Tax=Arundo donax TaxID=35708 RepID=A0A0A9FKB2_ARUDO
MPKLAILNFKQQ